LKIDDYRFGYESRKTTTGRTTPLTPLTLPPMSLTEPSLRTFAALNVLLPGDRSHHQLLPLSHT
jgi:hypothetical protein